MVGAVTHQPQVLCMTNVTGCVWLSIGDDMTGQKIAKNGKTGFPLAEQEK